MEQSLYELPEGWGWKPLSALANMSRKSILPENGEVYNYIGLEHIEGGTGHLVDYEPIKGCEISSTKTAFTRNMVLYGKLRPYLNKVHVAKFDGIATTEIIPFECHDELLAEYLARYMRSGHFLDAVMANCSGARMPRATTKFFKTIAQIPVPPLNEQKRIVAKLDALFTRIDAAITHLQETLELSKALFASALDGVFVRLSITHPQNTLGEIGKIIRGSSPRPKGDPQYYGGNVPRLMVADVTRDGKMVTPRIDSLTEEGAKKSRPVPKGTLTIQVSGNPGTPAILAIDACIHDGFAALIDVDQNEFSSEYLYYALLNYREQSNRLAVGAIFRNLTTSQLRKISVPIAGVAEQRTVVNKLDTLAERTNALEAETQERLDQLATLKSSLLDAAFRGQL